MIDHRFSRRDLLRAVACAAGAGTARSAFAQGRCMRTFGIPACNTTAIAAVFAPTGWKTTSLEHVTFRVADYRKEAAFYIALMGWTLRSDDGKRGAARHRRLGVGDLQAGPGRGVRARRRARRPRRSGARGGRFVLRRHRAMERENCRARAEGARSHANRRNGPERVRELPREGS